MWVLGLLVAVLVGVVATIGIIVLLGWLVSTPPYQGPIIPPFDGRRFRNERATPHNDFRDAAKWATTRQRGPWRAYRDEPPGPPPPSRVDGDSLRVTFINHTTVLVQTRGLNMLTDPIWSERCGPVSWFGPRRVRPPGIRFEDLPRIDVVLVSHNHYDHCDVPTLRRLARKHSPRFIAPLGNRRYLEQKKIPLLAELNWWGSVSISPDVNVTAVPARHFSGR